MKTVFLNELINILDMIEERVSELEQITVETFKTERKYNIIFKRIIFKNCSKTTKDAAYT